MSLFGMPLSALLRTQNAWTALQTFGAGLTVLAGQLLLPDGTVTAPSLSWSSDAGNNTGWYYISANTIGFASNGVRVATFGPGLFNFWEGSGAQNRLSVDLAGDVVTSTSAIRFGGQIGLETTTLGYGLRAYNESSIQLEAAQNGTNGSIFLTPKGTGRAFLTDAVSTLQASIIGKATVNTTAVGNVGAGEDDLMTYSLPASALKAAGVGVHITVWGTTASNANAKTLKLYFGTAVILTNALTISIAGVWRVEADVFSTGIDTQDYVSQLVTTGTAGVALNDIEVGSLTQDDGAAITIKCTGEATSNNDIIQEGMLVTFLS